MRKLPQDLAFPLGMGSKRQPANNNKNIPNGDGLIHNNHNNIHRQISSTTIETAPPNTVPDESANI